MPQYDLFSDYVNTSGTDESSAVARESTAAGDSGYDRLSDTGAHENPVQPETSSMQPRVYTVPEINSQIASLFDEIPEVYVKGELSNCDNNRPDARFFYCVIKGSDSELSVAFPMGVIRGELNRIHNGVQVVIRGDVKFYRTKGRVTLWGSRISIIDRYGELYLQFLQTKDTLEKEGLFDPASKKAIPEHVHTVGVITAPQSMAAKDVIRTIRSRNPQIDIIFYPASVQGNSAVSELMYAIYYANLHNMCQVLLIVRGGGSAEDISCFNDEGLARYVKLSKIPVITGVGHEGDYTIIDFVADERAATPTAAAVRVSENMKNILERYDSLRYRLWQTGMGRFNAYMHKFKILKASFLNCEPEKRLARLESRLQVIKNRFNNVHNGRMQFCKQQLNSLRERLYIQNPAHLIERKQGVCRLYRERMDHAVTGKLDALHDRIKRSAALLNANNPLKILMQGYSVTTGADGTTVRASGVKEGDSLRTITSDGEIFSRVEKVCLENRFTLDNTETGESAGYDIKVDSCAAGTVKDANQDTEKKK